MRSETWSLIPVLWCTAATLYAAAALCAGTAVLARKPFLLSLSRVGGLLGFAVQTAAIAVRWQHQGEFPFRLEAGEAFYFLVWAVVAAYLAIESFGHLRGLEFFLWPLLTLGYCLTLGYRSGKATPAYSVQLDPVLVLHILLALLSYAFFVVSFLLGLMVLVQTRALKRKRLGPVFEALPPIDLLQRWNAGAVAIGLPLLTVALFLGGVYVVTTPQGDLARWFADPTVIASLLLWVLGLVIVILRYVRRISGKRIADLTVCGFAVVILSLYGASMVRHGN